MRQVHQFFGLLTFYETMGVTRGMLLSVDIYISRLAIVPTEVGAAGVPGGGASLGANGPSRR